MNRLDQDFLNKIFPSSRTDEFFDALFGGAEEGAYDIRLVCNNVGPKSASFGFELHQRPGKCLVCNLTYGLPQVFQRHPVLNVAGVVEAICNELGWTGKTNWKLGSTQEKSRALHVIPLEIECL